MCEVIGTDISPTQPSWVPVNLRFEMDDCTAIPWTFAPSSFDLVHLRYLLGAIRDWDALYAETFRVLRPGTGWAEAVEPSIHVRSDDGSVCEGDGSALGEWGPLFEEATRKYAGRQPTPSMRVVEDDILITAFQRAGFVDVVRRTFKCPLTPFPRNPHLKDVGMYARFAFEEGMEGMYIISLSFSRKGKEKASRFLAPLLETYLG